MDKETIIKLEDNKLAQTYAKRPIVLVGGKGSIVWDIDGKEYIDCMAGYGVCILGHSHPRIVEVIGSQAKQLITCHGSFYNDARAEFLKNLSEVLPGELNRVFLSNSGSESVECAIKLARRYTGRKEIIAMMRAFHGKTLGSLSATWDKKYRAPFEPLVPGFKHVPFGNISKLRSAISNNTAAVLIEPIQGEGGVFLPPNDFLQQVRELCDEKGALLILDEVQTGIARTGRMFAFEHWGVVPDILCLAKAIANGLPMGVTAARDDIMLSFRRGEHSTTFGGNAMVCKVASTTLDIIKSERLYNKAKELGDYFMGRLKEIKQSSKIVRDVRGKGLMLAMELRFPCYLIILKALEYGVILLDAGPNILRFLPPLVIKRDQIDKVCDILSELIKEEERARGLR